MSSNEVLKEEVVQAEVAPTELEPEYVGLEIQVESSQVTHKCARCWTECKSAAGLKRHSHACKGSIPVQISEEDSHVVLELSPAKKWLKCTECPKKFKFKKSFKKHMSMAHSKGVRSAQCPKCPERYKSKKKLAEHLATHRQWTCEDCKKTFTRHYHLLRHQRQKCGNSSGIKDFSCNLCASSFSRKDNLLNHMRMHAGGGECRRTCNTCSVNVPSFSALIRHHNREHFSNKMQCDQCGNVVSSRVAFVKHMAVHGDRKFPCDQCEFRTKSIEILRRHMLKHSSVKPHACQLCPCSFIQHHELVAHMFKHTGTSSIVCHYCGDCFATKATLLSHMSRVHEKRKDLLCTYEGCRMSKRPFVNELSLKIHLKSHSEPSKYRCRSCEKVFYLKAALQSHELTHQWQKPRRCIYCVTGRAYIRGDLLMRHVRIKHPDTFADNLRRIRTLLGKDPRAMLKLSKDEVAAMVNMFDALHEHKLERVEDLALAHIQGDGAQEEEESPNDFDTVMNEEELAENIKMMMELLIDTETLELLGWPDAKVDTMLEKILEQCQVRVAESDKFSRVACLRENTKQLFLRVVEDSTISRMLNTRTVDEVIKHVVFASRGAEEN